MTEPLPPPPPLAPAEWLAANGQFLAASVGWVREVLRQHAQAAPDGAAGKPQAPQATPDTAARALRRADDLAATVPPPALVTLGQRAALTRFEQDILLMCAAAELDPSIRGLCAAAQGNPAMTYPTFALAMTVLPARAWDALAPGGRLRDLRLIEVNRPWGESLISSPLRTDERIVNYLKGLDHLDARLSPLTRPVPESDEHLLPPSHLAAVAVIAAHLAVGAGVVQLTGPDQASALTVASAATARAGLRLLRMPAATVPRSPAEAEDLTRLWQREGMLSDIALCVDVGDNPAADPAGTATDLAAFTERLAIPVLVRARESLPAFGPRGLVLDIQVFPRKLACCSHGCCLSGGATGERKVPPKPAVRDSSTGTFRYQIDRVLKPGPVRAQSSGRRHVAREQRRSWQSGQCAWHAPGLPDPHPARQPGRCHTPALNQDPERDPRVGQRQPSTPMKDQG